MKKIASLLLITILFLVVMLSTFFIANEIHHHCDGDECPICILIEQCENTLKQIKYGFVNYYKFALFLLIISIVHISHIFYLIEDSLVSQKIRMNN